MLSSNNSIRERKKYKIFRITSRRIIEYFRFSRPFSRNVAIRMRLRQKYDRGSIKLIYPHDGTAPEKFTFGRAPFGLICKSIGFNLNF